MLDTFCFVAVVQQRCQFITKLEKFCFLHALSYYQVHIQLAPKSWVGEKPLLSVLTSFQQPPPPRSSIYGKDEQMAKTDMAVSSSATLADSQCMEAAEVIRAEKEHLASVVRTAISVRCARDIMTLTACVPQRSGDIESEGYERSLEHCISVYRD
ncbi:BnaC02g34910D [Brassica napus]|uniref:BnaC02g34910D protein n=1 Tax=Brassica napus TaxID=3708 RepID=A0A078HK05_BRANA|nr:BnaC02g34910D [Brassica napus]